MPRPSLRLRRDLRTAIGRGHPWVYDRAAAPIDAAPGALVALTDGRGRFATAFVDPDGPIRARVLALDPDAAVDAAWVQARAAIAAGHRRLPPELADTDALRIVHGENDGLPGLTVDVYAGIAVVVFDGVAAAAFWEPRLHAVLAGIADAGIAVRATWIRAVRGGGGRAARALAGDVPAVVAIREGRARFDVEVRHGQKTGYFLDQRANRARVAALAGGARVLNLFSYTGGFSIRAGLAGAAQVTSVDVAAPAFAAAERHWRANGLPAGGHEAVAADAFAFLERAAAARRRWDVVIVDPPSFAPSEAARAHALPAYERLNRLALAVTAADGVLVSASCSSHITELDLRGVLVRAAPPAALLRVIDARGAAADHPTRPGFPEGRYLKLLIAAV